MDVRRLQGAFPEADAAVTTEGVESAAVAAAVALVLKLSEARFTPLFMTALEWSRARTEGCARPLAFFRLVSALAAALRSVFVPFFRHLLTDCVAHLEEQPGDSVRPAKKSRAAAGGAGALARVNFRLRTEVVRSLGSCFLHDAVGFLDETRFNKLMRPLVLQITLEVPADASTEEVADMDAALVDCIFQMAQNVRQDTLWRPLNRSVLLATRSEQTRPRRLGLAVVARLVESLAEEYLVLLPETLPFLAELMEDADEEVEATARQLVTSLSALAEEDVAELLAS
jgi:U3 small nucleolar RNA-associated protein 10